MYQAAAIAEVTRKDPHTDTELIIIIQKIIRTSTAKNNL